MIQTIIQDMFTSYDPVEDRFDQEIADNLRELVGKIAIPRDIDFPENELVREMIVEELSKYCDFCFVHGQNKNVIAGWGERSIEDKFVIGAHYDGPQDSPGADDNASAVATLIEVARNLKDDRPEDLLLVAFNGEEYGFLGSKEFVDDIKKCKGACILEMVGYYTDEPNSQLMPEGINLPGFDVGNFLGIIELWKDSRLGNSLMDSAKAESVGLPIKHMHIKNPEIINYVPMLTNVYRSDNVSFWDAGFQAVMITDTSNFRNPNYHTLNDTPDTLNYEKMSEVVRLLTSWGKS